MAHAVNQTTDHAGAASAAPDRSTGTPVLAVEGLAVCYGRAVALRDVSLEVPAGGAVALLGANGAGKTTTIRSIAGLLARHDAHLTAGTITLRGQQISGRKSHDIAKLRIAHVPEGRQIFANLSVEDNLRLGAVARRSAGADQSMAKVLELFPVLQRRFKDAGGYLSGGEQQMLAISRALMADPEVILLDEVSLGLAPLITRSIFETLAAIRAEFGTSMLVVEQNANLALEFCDSAYVVENGTTTLHGTAAELRADSTVRDLYLGGAHA
jgi:branched-chain amino acid transport system ATP-binding protein